MENSIGIIGAGITGLTLARSLFEEGYDITVYEKQAAPGGVMQSHREGEWLAETGPNTFLVKTGRVERFLHRTSITEHRLFAPPEAKRRYILRDGKLRELPSGPIKFLTTNLFSTRAKFRLLKEPFVGKPPEDEEQSVAEFVRRRIGQEFLDYAINPFVAGVYAGDPKQLSLKHAMPQMHNLEQQYGSLIWGMLRGSRERKERDRDLPQHNRIFSFPDGLGQLPALLAKPLEDHIHYGTKVTGFRQNRNETWQVTFTRNDESQSDTRQHSALVSTLPLHRLSDLQLDLASSDALSPLQSVTYPPLSVWTFGVHRSQVDHPLDGFGMLLPEIENRSILGTLFSSTLFPGRAPDNHAMLTSFVGGARLPDLAQKPEDEQRSLVLRDLQDLLGLEGEPAFEHVVHWPHAIPQYELGYGSVKKALKKLEEANPGLYLAGNYREGASINDCMDYALRLSDRL